VARGEVKYSDYLQQYSFLLAAPAATAPPTAQPPAQHKAAKQQAPAAPQQAAVEVPEKLVGVQAYLLWEQAGKPDGADFADRARQLLEERLRGGESLEAVEASLHTPPQAPAKQAKQQAAPAQQQQQAAQQQQQQAPAAAPAVVGTSMGMRSCNPLDLINRSSVPLLSEKPRAVRSPLTPLLEATAGDASISWHRVRVAVRGRGSWEGGRQSPQGAGGSSRGLPACTHRDTYAHRPSP
jgi:alpha-glucan,water dikinase